MPFSGSGRLLFIGTKRTYEFKRRKNPSTASHRPVAKPVSGPARGEGSPWEGIPTKVAEDVFGLMKNHKAGRGWEFGCLIHEGGEGISTVEGPRRGVGQHRGVPVWGKRKVLRIGVRHKIRRSSIEAKAPLQERSKGKKFLSFWKSPEVREILWPFSNQSLNLHQGIFLWGVPVI